MDGSEGNAKVYDRPEQAQPSPLAAIVIIVVLAALIAWFVYNRSRANVAANNFVPSSPPAGAAPTSINRSEGLTNVRLA